MVKKEKYKFQRESAELTEKNSYEPKRGLTIDIGLTQATDSD